MDKCFNFKLRRGECSRIYIFCRTPCTFEVLKCSPAALPRARTGRHPLGGSPPPPPHCSRSQCCHWKHSNAASPQYCAFVQTLLLCQGIIRLLYENVLYVDYFYCAHLVLGLVLRLTSAMDVCWLHSFTSKTKAGSMLPFMLLICLLCQTLSFRNKWLNPHLSSWY